MAGRRRCSQLTRQGRDRRLFTRPAPAGPSRVWRLEVVLLEYEKGAVIQTAGRRSCSSEWATNGACSAACLLAALPLVGLVPLLLRSELDPHFENYRAHFVVFGIVGGVAFILGYTAGEAASGAAMLASSCSHWLSWRPGLPGVHALGTPGSSSRRSSPASGRDPGRSSRQRLLRGGIGVRRRASRARPCG